MEELDSAQAAAAREEQPPREPLPQSTLNLLSLPPPPGVSNPQEPSVLLGTPAETGIRSANQQQRLQRGDKVRVLQANSPRFAFIPEREATVNKSGMLLEDNESD